MSRKADPSSRRSPRRRAAPEVAAELVARPPRKVSALEETHDSDFGLAFALAPTLRRPPDA